MNLEIEAMRDNLGKKKLRALMLDNYDSFTFNLVQYLLELGIHVDTVRNDASTPLELEKKFKPHFYIISPGPSDPDNAGVSLDLVHYCSKNDRPLLGICLGHQAIGQALGGKIVRAKIPMHGKVAKISHDGKGVFKGIPENFTATRYHSLVIEPQSLPQTLMVSAKSEDGAIMAIQHRNAKIAGVQFHPESVLTEYGHCMLYNFASQLGSKNS